MIEAPAQRVQNEIESQEATYDAVAGNLNCKQCEHHKTCSGDNPRPLAIPSGNTKCCDGCQNKRNHKICSPEGQSLQERQIAPVEDLG